MTTDSRLRVDARWAGNHGIGRYATEVLPRLTVPFTDLGLDGSPSDPLDAWRHRGAAKGATSYSPGYNAFLGGGRQIVTIHDLIHLTTKGPALLKYRAYYDGVLKPVVRRAGIVLTDSEASTRAIREWVADDDVRIVNAAAGCSATFTPDGSVRRFDRPTFISVGNLRVHKNMDTFLSALAQTDYGAVIVAPQPEREEFDRRAFGLGLEGRLTVVSGVSDADLAAMYRGAVGTVFPSLLEGFGLPALESIRTGTPVAFWRGCESVAEIVGDSGVGVESPSDAEEWAHALETLVDGVEVAALPEDMYTWESTAAVVDQTLREAL